mmetsp:Transcript_14604/g.41566  ORF Transcript_14604/g.41566 Transcript_14604/m.41566 type:complete len:279 (-) Transcript_14604:759-1595(-)
MPTRWIKAFPRSTAVKALSEAVVNISTTFLMTFSSSAGEEGSVTSTLTGCVGFSGLASSGWGFAASPQTDTWFMGRSWCMRKCVGNLSSKPRNPSKFVLITAYVSGSSALHTSPNLADWALPPSCRMTRARKSTYGFAEPRSALSFASSRALVTFWREKLSLDEDGGGKEATAVVNLLASFASSPASTRSSALRSGRVSSSISSFASKGATCSNPIRFTRACIPPNRLNVSPMPPPASDRAVSRSVGVSISTQPMPVTSITRISSRSLSTNDAWKASS